MRIKNWLKFKDYCWALRIEPQKKKRYVYRICIKYMKGFKEWKIETALRVRNEGMRSGLFKGNMGYSKSFSPLYKKVIAWMRKHPNG